MKYFYLLIISLCFSCNTERNKEQDHYDTDLTPSQKATVETDEEWNQDQINDFIREAAMIDKMQIRVGKIAQEKAVNESIKIYGKMLEEDHTHSFNNLKDLAKNQQVNIPNSLDQEHLNKVKDLQSSNGAAFERKFLRMMIKGHIKDIEKFRRAQKSIKNDHEIKKWIDEALPALHRHRQKGEQLQQARDQDDL